MFEDNDQEFGGDVLAEGGHQNVNILFYLLFLFASLSFCLEDKIVNLNLFLNVY